MSRLEKSHRFQRFLSYQFYGNNLMEFLISIEQVYDDLGKPKFRMIRNKKN